MHELERHCALKRAHILLKCLMKKVDKFNWEHRVFDVELDENMARSQVGKLIDNSEQLENTDQVNRCMRYGHIFLSPDEMEKHGELKKKNISINAAAAKQILFQKATEEDYTPGYTDQSRALTLMKAAIADITETRNLLIDNHIHHSFPPIYKVSVRETLSDKFGELASTLLCQYDKLSSSISTLVSINVG